MAGTGSGTCCSSRATFANGSEAKSIAPACSASTVEPPSGEDDAEVPPVGRVAGERARSAAAAVAPIVASPSLRRDTGSMRGPSPRCPSGDRWSVTMTRRYRYGRLRADRHPARFVSRCSRTRRTCLRESPLGVPMSQNRRVGDEPADRSAAGGEERVVDAADGTGRLARRAAAGTHRPATTCTPMKWYDAVAAGAPAPHETGHGSIVVQRHAAVFAGWRLGTSASVTSAPGPAWCASTSARRFKSVSVSPLTIDERVVADDLERVARTAGAAENRAAAPTNTGRGPPDRCRRRGPP